LEEKRKLVSKLKLIKIRGKKSNSSGGISGKN